MDKDIIEIIDYVQEYSQLPIEFDQKNETLSLLFKRGYFLTSPNEERKRAEIFKTAYTGESHQASFLLLLTYNCNFRCLYCYEQNLRDKSKEFLEKVLSETQVNAAFQIFDDMLEKLSQRSTLKQGQTILLYGGEPFLPQTMNIVDKIGSKIEERKWVLRAITNGYYLEEFLPIIRKYAFTHFQVTLDGPKEVHDSRRFRQGHKPTFDKIVRGIEKVLDEKPEIQIGLKMNIDLNNMSRVPEFLNFCEEKGWIQAKSRVNVGLSAVTPYINGKNYCSYPSDIEFVRDLYKILGDSALFAKILQYYLRIFLPYPIQDDSPKIDRGMFPRFYNCGANTQQFILDPFGFIYSCWGVVGIPSFAIGKYSLSGFELSELELKKWRRSVLDIPQCSECNYALICAGGCVYRALTAGKDHLGVYCGHFHEIFEEFVPRHIIARMKEKNSPWYLETN
ncbi:MAG: radical SAM protein [Candidatus Hodarchaeales archaeon]